MIKNFLFDLDGTLSDPSEGITKSVAHALKYFGIEVQNLSDLNVFIGPPLVDGFMEFYGLSEDQAQKGLLYYRERFSVVGKFENNLFQEVPSMLKELKERGKTLVIATSKPTVYTVDILKHFGIYDYFDYISGNTLSEEHPTKEEIIDNAVRALGIDPLESVMVGDRKFDINAGKYFGMKTVGCAFGFPVGDELQKAGADYIAKTPKEMKDIILSL
jgi:phosphoglycolate phosphatase